MTASALHDLPDLIVKVNAITANVTAFIAMLICYLLSTKIIVIQIKGSININIEMPLNHLQFQFLLHLPP